MMVGRSLVMVGRSLLIIGRPLIARYNLRIVLDGERVYEPVHRV